MSSSGFAGRTFFVTGANSGIGKAAVEALAAGGGKVVLASRSAEKTRPVLDAIRSRWPSAEPRFVQIDMADLDSVKRAGEQYIAEGQPLDVLINNAGVAGTEGVSPDGFDITYATNHIGPFLLTNILLPRIQESEQGRVVNVSSVANKTAKAIDWSTLERKTGTPKSGFPAYAATKLMNILHARELARRLAGTRVTTYAVHPGAVASNIWRALPGPLQWGLKLFLISNEKGAAPVVYFATDPALAAVSGRYYERFKETAPNPLAEDPALARELWNRTEAAIAAAWRR
ncbi:MAG TPA: SDR family oxidoreductase [Gemmatimonadales bacterium]|nr:SDR family oxidoreductase [Gemmatimonadales bacterium]